MSDIRKLPKQEPRVETGPVQFGNDWPGVFIRGDNAAYYAMTLEGLLDELQQKQELSDDWIRLAILRSLQIDLVGCVLKGNL